MALGSTVTHSEWTWALSFRASSHGPRRLGTPPLSRWANVQEK